MSEARHDAKAASWTMASRVVAQCAQFVVFLVAARFLTPEQFGMYMVIAAINMLLMKVAEAGWQEFTSTWRGSADGDAHVFTLATLSGLLLALLGSLAGALMTAIPSLAEYAMLQILLSLSVAFRGTFMVWSGYLIRTQRASLLAKAVLVAQLLHCVVSIGGLMAGWGLEALASGKLVIHCVGPLIVALAVGWFPGWRLSSSGRETILRFQRSLLSTHLISYLQANAATLVLGLFLGPAAVGLYRAGARVVGSIADVIGEPLRVVCWMAMRRAADTAAATGDAASAPGDGVTLALSRNSERFITFAVAVTTPVFLGLAATSELTVEAMLGEQWVAAAPVVAILAIARLLSTPMILTAPLLSTAQRVEKIAVLQLYSGAATLIALPLFAPFGILATAVGQLLATIVGTWLAVQAQARYGAVHWLRAIFQSSPATVASFAMCSTLIGMKLWAHEFSADTRLQLAVEVGFGGLVFLVLFTLLGGWRQLARSYAR